MSCESGSTPSSSGDSLQVPRSGHRLPPVDPRINFSLVNTDKKPSPCGLKSSMLHLGTTTLRGCSGETPCTKLSRRRQSLYQFAPQAPTSSPNICKALRRLWPLALNDVPLLTFCEVHLLLLNFIEVIEVRVECIVQILNIAGRMERFPWMCARASLT